MQIDQKGLALAEDLITSLHTANRLDGYFARQAGGPFGAIHDAVVLTLAAALVTADPLFWEDARAIATRLLDEALDNGENLAYQIDLLNRGVIS